MSEITVNRVVKNIELTVNKTEKVVEINRIFQAGKSAYELAVDYGFVGTEEEWVELQQALTDQSAASAATATAQAVISTTKANESSASAAAALVSQNAASVSAVTASSQAGIATTQATNASTSATNAANSAQEAETFKNEAEAAIAEVNGIVTSKIQPWAAQAYASASQVNHLGIDYVSNAATLSTDVPGVSSKWVERLYTIFAEITNYESDLNTKTNFNSSIKAIYIIQPPAVGHRYAIEYFARNGSTNTYELKIIDLNIATGSTTVLVNNTGITYPFDEVTPIYSDSTSTVIVGYIYAALDDYIGFVGNYGQGPARFPYLLSNSYDYLKQILIFDYLNTKTINDVKTGLRPSIVIWGDSISWGSNPEDGNYFSKLLKEKLITDGYKNNVINCAVGGETAQSIPVRQGAFGLYASEDFTIPADLSEIAFGSITSYIYDKYLLQTYDGADSGFTILIQGEGRDETNYPTVNPVYVNGIACTLKWTPTVLGDNSNGVYTLKRNATGTATLIKEGTLIVPNGSKFKSSCMVVFMGTNGGFFVQNPDNSYNIVASANSLLNRVKAMIRQNGNTNVIIMTPYGGTALTVLGVDGLAEIESQFSREFGNQYINIRKHLIDYGLDEESITASSGDITAMAAGHVPPSLLADVVHPNSAGHRVIFRALFNRLSSIGALVR